MGKKIFAEIRIADTEAYPPKSLNGKEIWLVVQHFAKTWVTRTEKPALG